MIARPDICRQISRARLSVDGSPIGARRGLLAALLSGIGLVGLLAVN